MQRLKLCSQSDLERVNNREDSKQIDLAARRTQKIASYREHKELEHQIKVFFHRKQKLGFDPYSWGSVSALLQLNVSLFESV